MDLDLLLVGASVGLGALFTVVSPVLRRVLAETFKHPTERSQIVRDRKTGELSSYVTSDEGDSHKQPV
jgi:hypothetical protein